jgi:uncharacterized protein YjbJ (UPF0337 family)
MADFVDKAQHKAEELTGQAKEKVGDATGNDNLRGDGAADQAKAKAPQVVAHTRRAAEKLARSSRR